MPAVHIVIDIRHMPRLRQLTWELRQLEGRLRGAGRSEADELERIVDRFIADISDDGPDAPPER
jgi:hypothetical protein